MAKNDLQKALAMLEYAAARRGLYLFGAGSNWQLCGVPRDRRDSRGPPRGHSRHTQGQYSHPLRVVAFNTAEGWSRDVRSR
jgi:hypothetical protein